MPEAVIVEAVRTPIGRAFKGSLRLERPDDMLAVVIRAALERVPELRPEMIEDVLAGCARPEQHQGANIARRAALLAGLPNSVPGATVSRFCASSLQALRHAFHAIRAGEGEAYIVCGIESVSLIDREPRGPDDLHPRLAGGDHAIADVYMPMGLTAENVVDRFDVRRDEMDLFAQRSQDLATAAQTAGFFEREILPYTTAGGVTVSVDDSPRPNSTLERLGALKPAFREGGSVTAGNSCPLSDGAAALVVMSDALARRLGVTPRARIVASAVSAVAPEIMGVGPVDAVRRALGRARMTIGDVDIFELNEAFAAQVIPVCRSLGIDPFDERVNPHGGGIALGHPFGMTGARIMTTLINGLETRDQTIGIDTMCAAGGQGMAMVVERVA